MMKIKLIGEGIFLGRAEIKKGPLKIGFGIPVESETLPTLDHLLQLRLSELAKRNIAIKIYSEILGCEIWLCSNATMALQIRADDPEAITYTVAEMRRLIALGPTADDLRNIHNAKSLFYGSKIIDGRNNGTQ